MRYRILREVFSGGQVTQRDILPMYGDGNPLNEHLKYILQGYRVESVRVYYQDHAKRYTVLVDNGEEDVDPFEGAVAGPDLPQMDGEETPTKDSWFQRALVRVCTEICRRGMGS